MRLSSVDLPMPFGPTMANRLSKSSPKFRLWNKVGPPTCVAGKWQILKNMCGTLLPQVPRVSKLHICAIMKTGRTAHSVTSAERCSIS
eukprot:375270-Pelagomonas_calceolata.AAC.1